MFREILFYRNNCQGHRSNYSLPGRFLRARSKPALKQLSNKGHLKGDCHCGYPSDSGSGHEMIEHLIVDPAQPVVFPELDNLEPLFSDQEKILPEELIRKLLPSLTETLAPLLSNPSLTALRSNFSLFSSQAGKTYCRNRVSRRN